MQSGENRNCGFVYTHWGTKYTVFITSNEGNPSECSDERFQLLTQNTANNNRVTQPKNGWCRAGNGKND
jgi:hypothetical protein